MKILPSILLASAFLLVGGALSAAPPGKGKGHGPGHGRMSDDFRGVIHDLFAHHDAFTRSVDLTATGYRAKTVSKDPKKGALLQKHVAQMESRLDGGMGVRHWDPAFAELRAHYDDMKVEIEKVEGGIAVVVTGETKAAIAVAQNHAKIISGFIKKGQEQMHARHPAVLADSDAAKAAPACGSCGKDGCGGSCGKGGGKGKGAGGGSGGGNGQKPCCAEATSSQPAKK